jgi:hypothetical protein
LRTNEASLRARGVRRAIRVWSTIQDHLPALRTVVEAELTALGPEP